MCILPTGRMRIYQEGVCNTPLPVFPNVAIKKINMKVSLKYNVLPKFLKPIFTHNLTLTPTIEKDFSEL
jgi:hypothetical protein